MNGGNGCSLAPFDKCQATGDDSPRYPISPEIFMIAVIFEVWLVAEKAMRDYGMTERSEAPADSRAAHN